MSTPTEKPAPAPVYMKCKNPKCTSIQAIEIPYAAGSRLYQCIKCKHVHPVLVGGQMDVRRL